MWFLALWVSYLKCFTTVPNSRSWSCLAISMQSTEKKHLFNNWCGLPLRHLLIWCIINVPIIIILENNVTTIIEVRSASACLFAGMWRPWWVLLQHRIMLRSIFSLSSVVSHAFSALCMYSKFVHHPHLLGYICAKFRSICGLHYWASPWRKATYSLNHSPSLFDAREPKCLRFGI